MNRPKFISFFLLLAFTLACITPEIPALAPVTPSPFPTLTPLPTITPTPTATFTPTATPDPTLLRDADFSAASCFDFEKTDDIKRFQEYGEFHIYVTRAGVLAASICRNAIFADMVLEADVYPAGGAFSNAYGLAFRYDRAKDEHYLFAISADGRYIFSVNKAGSITPKAVIVNWTASPAINLGKQVNHLKVIAVGERFQLYINEQFVNEVYDARLRVGETGLAVLSSEKDGAHISFDNFRISQPLFLPDFPTVTPTVTPFIAPTFELPSVTPPSFEIPTETPIVL